MAGGCQVMSNSNIELLASDLRVVISQLVRQVRHVDELPPRFAEVLRHLDREGPLTIGDLATRQRVRQQSMTTTVAELSALGYVERHAHPSDGRKTLIQISTQGREILIRDRQNRIRWITGAITTHLTPDEQHLLGEAIPLLARLVNNPTVDSDTNDS
jgi:DNA-binding MarR family transcriptional regulator